MNKKKKIFVIAGHSNTDPGARGAETTEAKESILLRDKVIAKLGSKYTVFKDDDNDGLRTVVEKVNLKADRGDILLSIHFNAFNKKATGSLALVYHASDAIFKLTTKCLVLDLSTLLDINNRGLGYENSGAHSRLAILNDTITKSILLEVCFIDNPTDFEKYKKHEDEVVNLLAQYLEDLANS